MFRDIVDGGNPFFVTEALGAPVYYVPATVRDAVNRWEWAGHTCVLAWFGVTGLVGSIPVAPARCLSQPRMRGACSGSRVELYEAPVESASPGKLVMIEESGSV
jgi:hypothetical protein